MAERRWSASDFDYPLPEDLIAQVPSPERGTSRLLMIDRMTTADSAALTDGTFADLATLVRAGDLMVVNSTRVRQARFLGRRPSGGAAEVLLIHPAGDGTWVAMGKPGRAMQPGQMIELADGIGIETVEVRDDTLRRVRFVGIADTDAITRFGRLPLPPYIDREPDDTDRDRYQTVYAAREGSVAAPTAGLHFTTTFLDALRARGVHVADLDLEVGPGTFRPVEVDDLSEHVMHAEHFEIPVALADEIAACRNRRGRVWAVGTTVVRALESAGRDDGMVESGSADTRLMITPGHRFRVVDCLVTNFHLPRSTLLMLVSAFAGHEITMDAYRHAVAQRYRFYSYGDAMCVV
ncbi:MAG: tRNA preQ1(34) S-adenosylmethionine ribosyltransferase-isomerase QueA [Gemmatimonadales bacterium]|nr:tRNA preQ1(34) S-adenosylmethionine ribosyltransferase-isomerase QueA [Gemmatimonadales bacterium]